MKRIYEKDCRLTPLGLEINFQVEAAVKTIFDMYPDVFPRDIESLFTSHLHLGGSRRILEWRKKWEAKKLDKLKKQSLDKEVL